MMTPEERYLFDLHGYLHVREVLSPDEVTTLRDLADRYHAVDDAQLTPPMRTYRDASTQPTNPRAILNAHYVDEPYQRLVVNPKLMRPVLELTDGCPMLLDVAVTRNTAENDDIPFHGGAVGHFHNPANCYQVKDGRCFATFVNAAVTLVDVPQGMGFTCVPGSHKAHFPRPAHVTHETDAPVVVNVCPRAGDMVIFTEALCHGALKWTADEPRRTVFVRYSTSYASWSPGLRPIPEFRDRLPDEVAELMEPAGFQHRKRVVKRLLEELGAH